jgi:hypothetical protein
LKEHKHSPRSLLILFHLLFFSITVQNAVNDLNAVVPAQMKAAGDALKKPNDQKTTEKFGHLEQKAKNDLDDIIAAHSKVPLDDAAHRMDGFKKQLNDVSAALKVCCVMTFDDF